MAQKTSTTECLFGDTIPNLKAGMDYLKKGFDEMKQDLKDHITYKDAQIQRIENLIKEWSTNADAKYATKVEHTQNKEKIDKIDSTLIWLNRLVLGAVITALLATVLINIK